MKKLALSISALLVSASVAAVPTVPGVSNVHIKNAVASYSLPAGDNSALVLMDGGDWGDVSIVQGVVPLSDGNLAVVDYTGSGNDNNTTIKQHREDNNALVQAWGDSGHNDVEIIQNDDARAWVRFGGDSDGNDVEILQRGSSNQARVAMRQNSDDNRVDIDQKGSNFKANVGARGNSDDNEVYILQKAGHSNSLAEVSFNNASHNDDNNQFNSTSGIYISQTTGDYAGVFISNADHNAVYIKQN
ncbi:curlin repeat-containing protein [Vibrio nomapromontoriensis]|uniref:curlin repeat-containing protein n=1 Tax=Vibrio nomapromontoriensis TaxID=2910246 RepID=UPI003D0B88ED